MKTLILGISLLIANIGLAQTEINAQNILGTFEARVLEPTTETLGLETYIVQYDLKTDGTLTYREYYNEERTVGILGTEDQPACEGTYTLENNILKTVTDCSRYTRVYNQEIDLSQISLEEITNGNTAEVESKTDLFPGVILVSEVKKL